MVGISQAACAKLSDMLSDYPAEVAARIVRRNDRMALRHGTLRPGDETVRHEGRIILLCSKSMVTSLRGRVLDVRTTKEGPKLGLRRVANEASDKE